MENFRFQLLGGFKLFQGDKAIELSSKKLQALLCYLAMNPTQAHSRSKLAALLWGDSNDSQARQSLRQCLAKLRRSIAQAEDWFDSDSDNIGFQASFNFAVDVKEFEELCKQDSGEALINSVALYHGDLLLAVNSRSEAFEQWLSIERDRLHHMALERMQKLISWHKDAQNEPQAVLVARQLLLLDPLNEAVHRELMTIYQQQEKYNDAIKQYQECKKALRNGLDIEPAAATLELFQSIMQQRRQPTTTNEETTAFNSGDTSTLAVVEEAQVLLVDDDPTIGNLLQTYLSKNGYKVFWAKNGDEMRQILSRHSIDVALLDIGLPGEDGLSLARYIRVHHDMAIIMVTAAGDVVDRIIGLEIGADDYVSKPFDPRELRARLKNVVRLYQKTPAVTKSSPELVKAGQCRLDINCRQLVDRQGQEIALSNLEFELLKLFVQNPYQILSRDDMAQQIQNRSWDPNDRSIDIRIVRLRQKIEANPDNPRFIKTVRGQGYMYVPLGDQA